MYVLFFFVEFLINLLGDIKYLNSLCIINDNYFVLEIIFFLIIVFIYNYFVVFFIIFIELFMKEVLFKRIINSINLLCIVILYNFLWLLFG